MCRNKQEAEGLELKRLWSFPQLLKGRGTYLKPVIGRHPLFTQALSVLHGTLQRAGEGGIVGQGGVR